MTTQGLAVQNFFNVFSLNNYSCCTLYVSNQTLSQRESQLPLTKTSLLSLTWRSLQLHSSRSTPLKKEARNETEISSFEHCTTQRKHHQLLVKLSEVAFGWVFKKWRVHNYYAESTSIDHIYFGDVVTLLWMFNLELKNSSLTLLLIL